jgi:ribonucleoside-diphosphate reductase alpha chain
MMPDSMGDGSDESALPSREADHALEQIRQVVSGGYVRNRLVVLPGGGGKAAAGGSSLSTSNSAGQAPRSPEASVRLASSSGSIGSGNGAATALARDASPEIIAVAPNIAREVDEKLGRIREARMKGYEGDACGDCGNFTLVRNGTCLKCDTCGATSGCS